MVSAPTFARMPAMDRTTLGLMSLAVPALPPCVYGIEPHSLPLRIGRELQISGEVGKLFDLRGQNSRLHAAMLAVGDRSQYLRIPAALGYRGVQHLAFTDQLRSESGGAAPLARRAAKDQGVPAVLDDGVRFTLAVGARDLGNGLKTEHAPAAEFAQARERVLQSVYLAQGIQFIDDEPQPAVRFA